MNGYYRLLGDIGSPYSMKMRAIMRYRRLPFVWLQINQKRRDETAHIRPPVIPKIQFPDDGTWHVDSTPMVYKLEELHPGQRSIIPEDPGLAFLSHLIEDMADEWMTKMMFHYRWWRKVDQKYCSYWLACTQSEFAPDDVVQEAARTFTERQVGRLALVGSTETTRPVIEESFLEVLEIMENHLKESPFLFGSRPALADFGIFGQFSQLNHDPTSQGIMRDKSRRFCAWIAQLDDASGLEEGSWINPDDPLPQGVIHLLKMAGSVYLPFLTANAEALNTGKDSFSLGLMGKAYEQSSFKYQLKCLNWLKEEYSQLQDEAKQNVDDILNETNCLQYLMVN